jgi:hypothetical protein
VLDFYLTFDTFGGCLGALFKTYPYNPKRISSLTLVPYWALVRLVSCSFSIGQCPTVNIQHTINYTFSKLNGSQSNSYSTRYSDRVVSDHSTSVQNPLGINSSPSPESILVRVNTSRRWREYALATRILLDSSWSYGSNSTQWLYGLSNNVPGAPRHDWKLKIWHCGQERCAMSSQAGMASNSSQWLGSQPQGPPTTANNGDNDEGVSIRPMRRMYHELIRTWLRKTNHVFNVQ